MFESEDSKTYFAAGIGVAITLLALFGTAYNIGSGDGYLNGYHAGFTARKDK